VTDPGRVAIEESRRPRPVFISYATADRKQALAVCKAVERRGTQCWISTRDVAPGENYQEAIVRSLRQAPALVLVFSKAANTSDEIKKELSLASRFRVPVIALRIEDVEPSDAFAYELSTRQWIEASKGLERSIDSLVSRVEELSRDDAGDESARAVATARALRRTSVHGRHRLAIAGGLSLLVIAAGAWWWLRPSSAAAHSMTVRLADFRSLSPVLPVTLHEAIGTEIIAAFNADGVIGVSTASAASGGSGPAYALGGTINRIGNTIRVITQFKNERSGVILWSDSKDYPASELAKVPHRIAVDAGTVVRCGLFGTSTYHKALPDSVLSNYMQYCQEYWAYGGSKTLLPAQRVVAAVPDFSWGWSAVANGFMQAVAAGAGNAAELRTSGLQAEARALALDPKNSEALAHKAYLIDPHDWPSQEALFKSAIAAKPLDCGCEHYGYGLTLSQVGRLDEAVEQFRAATDMLSLWPDSQISLATTLIATGDAGEAKSHIDTAIELSEDPMLAQSLAIAEGTETGDYAQAIAALRDPRFHMPEAERGALLAGYQALASGDPKEKGKAIHALLPLATDEQRETVATMLGALGASHEALLAAGERPWLFWHRSMRGSLNDPSFPAVVKHLGLVSYWKATHTKPDVCGGADAPAFCRMI